jgi:hypothetical protein
MSVRLCQPVINSSLCRSFPPSQTTRNQNPPPTLRIEIARAIERNLTRTRLAAARLATARGGGGDDASISCMLLSGTAFSSFPSPFPQWSFLGLVLDPTPRWMGGVPVAEGAHAGECVKGEVDSSAVPGALAPTGAAPRQRPALGRGHRRLAAVQKLQHQHEDLVLDRAHGDHQLRRGRHAAVGRRQRGGQRLLVGVEVAEELAEEEAARGEEVVC